MQTHKEVTKQGETGWGLASCCLMPFSWKCNLFLGKQHQDRFTFIFLLLVTAFSMQGRWLPWIHKGWDWCSSSYQPAVNSVLSNSNFPLNLKQWDLNICVGYFSPLSPPPCCSKVSPQGTFSQSGYHRQPIQKASERILQVLVASPWKVHRKHGADQK